MGFEPTLFNYCIRFKLVLRSPTSRESLINHGTKKNKTKNSHFSLLLNIPSFSRNRLCKLQSTYINTIIATSQELSLTTTSLN